MPYIWDAKCTTYPLQILEPSSGCTIEDDAIRTTPRKRRRRKRRSDTYPSPHLHLRKPCNHQVEVLSDGATTAGDRHVEVERRHSRRWRRVDLVHNRENDAKDAAATATQTPEQVRVLAALPAHTHTRGCQHRGKASSHSHRPLVLARTDAMITSPLAVTTSNARTLSTARPSVVPSHDHRRGEDAVSQRRGQRQT
jgi:hypothetical protein